MRYLDRMALVLSNFKNGFDLSKFFDSEGWNQNESSQPTIVFEFAAQFIQFLNFFGRKRSGQHQLEICWFQAVQIDIGGFDFTHVARPSEYQHSEHTWSPIAQQ
jgi:hypothetical protein